MVGIYRTCIKAIHAIAVVAPIKNALKVNFSLASPISRKLSPSFLSIK